MPLPFSPAPFWAGAENALPHSPAKNLPRIPQSEPAGLPPLLPQFPASQFLPSLNLGRTRPALSHFFLGRVLLSDYADNFPLCRVSHAFFLFFAPVYAPETPRYTPAALLPPESHACSGSPKAHAFPPLSARHMGAVLRSAAQKSPLPRVFLPFLSPAAKPLFWDNLPKKPLLASPFSNFQPCSLRCFLYRFRFIGKEENKCLTTAK